MGDVLLGMSLQIGKFDKPALIKRGDTKIPLTLKFNLNETGMEFETKLYLHTNASTFVIPIYVYNGRLQVVCWVCLVCWVQLDSDRYGAESS